MSGASESLGFLDLPFDILDNIFRKVNLSDIRNLMLTCKFLNNFIIRDSSLWRFIFGKVLIVKDPVDFRRYTRLWYHKYRISYNWNQGIHRSKIVIQHNENFMPWMKYYSANSKYLLLAVGSELRCYGTDKRGVPVSQNLLWSINVPKVIRKDIRTNDISRFVIRDNTIICGNRNGCVSIYSVTNNDIRKKPQLTHHLRDCIESGCTEVSAVEVMTDQAPRFIYTVAASSNSPNFSMYAILLQGEKKIEKREISLPDISGIRCVAVDRQQRKLALGCITPHTQIPVIFDLESDARVNAVGERSAYRRGRTWSVRDMHWIDDNVIAFVSHCGKLRCLDFRTQKVVYEAADPFQSSMYCVRSDGDRALVVGTAEYCRCVLFDRRKPYYHVQMYFPQKKKTPVYCLDFDSTKLIAAADRNVVTLDFNVNVGNATSRDYSLVFDVIA